MDGAGAVYGDKEPLKRIYEVANAPIFSFDQSYFNGEIVGGPMFSPAEGAQPMAAVAVRMLGGEKASGINPIGFSTPKYDWRQLQRWNISESRLPPGSEILFREPTVWERYSWQIASIVAVLLIQAGLISVLLREHRRRQSGRSAVAAAHGRTCPCQPLLDRWRTDRLHCSRNQPAARLYSDQRRNRRGNSEISKPDIADSRHH